VALVIVASRPSLYRSDAPRPEPVAFPRSWRHPRGRPGESAFLAALAVGQPRATASGEDDDNEKKVLAE